jgi:hypothetical protein
MNKKIDFRTTRPSVPQAGNVDDWVLDRPTDTSEPMKRLTIDVPINLHKRIKSQCAMQNLVMADVIRELLEQRFPQAAGAEQGLPS